LFHFRQRRFELFLSQLRRLFHFRLDS
jgi:hypothetical protein